MQQTPVFNDVEARTQAVFTAMMWALSYPGRPQQLPTAELSAIGETLLDLETTFYASDPTLAAELRRTTARELSVERADYLFFPTLSEANLADIAQANTGNMLYPDRSATIIAGCRFEQGVTLRLTGPGIQHEQLVQINQLSPNLFEVREAAINYPLGWDLFLVDADRLIGLPRTTTIEVL